MNPCKFSATHLLKRGRATSDGQVAKIRWMPIDWDAEEEPIALREYLDGLGFPEPFVGFSGHGWWLLYRVAQENTREATELRRRFLAALKGLYPGVDTTSYNPSRVMRCFGTLNVKEPSAPVRSRVASLPDETHVVPDELLELVASGQPEQAEPSPEQGTPGDADLILAKLAERGITVTRTKPAGKPGMIHELSSCPFYPDKAHDRAAALYVWDDGNLHFECLGETCQNENHRYLDLLALLDLRPRMAGGGKSKVLWASEIVARKPRVTFGGRLVFGELNAIVGREKMGKGLLWVRIAADLSTGTMTGRPETVLYVSAEEQLQTVQRPRLEAAGADLGRVLVMPMGGLGLPDALPELTELVGDYGAQWWILDPLNKHFSRNLDPDSKRDVAMVLGELAAVVEQHDVTIVGSLHLGRGKEGQAANDAWAHSTEFRRAIRSALLIGRVEADGQDDRTIVHEFSNYGRTGPAIHARITEVDETGTKVLGAEDPFVEADDLFWRPKTVDGSTRAECAERILAVWNHAGRPQVMPSSALSTVGNAYSNGTVARAREHMGITVTTDSVGQSGLRNLWDFSGVTL